MTTELRKLALLLPIAGALGGAAQGQDWTLVDDMEGIDNWTNLQGTTSLATDPEDGTNTAYLAVSNTTGGLRGQAYLTIPAIADNSTGTLFFRLYTEANGSVFDWVVGASDLAEPVAGFGSYDGYGRLSDGAMDVRNTGVTGSFSEVGPASAGTWYNVWLVLHNTPDGTDDTTDMYFNTGGAATAGGTLSFIGGVFRNEATDLVSLLVRNNEGGAIDAYIDDVYIDTTGENLSDPLLVDTDLDGMADDWEMTFFGDLTRDGTGDFEPDGLLDLDEFNEGSDPTNSDTDGDTLTDGAEVAGTSNDFGSGGTSPIRADTDGDGVDDFEENGSLNTQFGLAATDPKDEDTDDDGMPDGYELSNNTPGTALDPNDDGSNDPSQAATADRDLDLLSNIGEFDPAQDVNISSVQTRADIADTDGDGYSDYEEDNAGFWVNGTQTGTNPTLVDTDGDGLEDGEENLDLVFNAGTIPTNSDPNLRDTDGDGFIDFLEVSNSTDPRDPFSSPSRAAGFTLVEDFQGAGMVVGNTYDGVNGWSMDRPADALVADEPIAGAGDQVGCLARTEGGTSEPYKLLDVLGLQINEGGVGTLFFQVYADATDLDFSFGLSDVIAPTAFGDFEAQTVLGQAPAEGTIRVRNAGGFENVGNYTNGVWMNVWMVADNASDTVRVYYESPVGETGQTEVTLPFDPVSFRNGTSESLSTLLTIVAGGSTLGSKTYVDNFYIDPDAVNLTTPAAVKPVAPDELVVTNVALNGSGDLEITFSPGGVTGFILTSASPTEILTPTFTDQANYTYDSVDTFTVSAAFIAANPGFFFRVEASP